MYKKFEKNNKGRDFVVGDLHGYYDVFLKELEKVNFDETKDRVFSVGDLIDRGKQNLECLSLLEKSWFHAVRGNHENMMLTEPNLWFKNGGKWSWDCDSEIIKKYKNKIKDLPYVIEIETENNGNIGICHAEFQDDDFNNIRGGEYGFYQTEEMVWGRTILTHRIEKTMKNIDYTIHGHTPLKKPTMLGNAIFIDTGVFIDDDYFNGYLTLLNITDKIDVKSLYSSLSKS